MNMTTLDIICIVLVIGVGMIGYITVSYTHLDVYKRQSLMKNKAD